MEMQRSPKAKIGRSSRLPGTELIEINDVKSSNEEGSVYGRSLSAEKHLRLEHDRYHPGINTRVRSTVRKTSFLKYVVVV